MNILGHLPQGLVFVLSAPSGTGKTTLVRMLMRDHPCIAESISATTRLPREGEVEGQDYFFLSEKEFLEKIKEEAFLEHADVFGFHYGTLKEHVAQMQQAGKHVFLVIDTQGVANLRRKKFDATYIFLSPPSEGELHLRLKSRNTESPEMIEKRLKKAKEELTQVHHYDYHIVNDHLESAYMILKSIVIAEEYKIRRSHEI